MLICDEIDPDMTFVVPLAAGIVERRGGILSHGAIIAREYGLSCVTGVPYVTELIHTGEATWIYDTQAFEIAPPLVIPVLRAGFSQYPGRGGYSRFRTQPASAQRPSC